MIRTLLVGVTLISLISSSPLMARSPKDDSTKKADEAKANPQAKLDTAIKMGIELLEAKKHKEFVLQFAPQDFVKKSKEENKLDEMIEQFGKQKAASMLELLKTIKDKKPRLENDGAKAIFDLEPRRFPKNKISFVRSNGLWYIEN